MTTIEWSAHGRRVWWVDSLGARRDPDSAARWYSARSRPDGSRFRRLELTSYGVRLSCLLIEPPGGHHQVVVLPNYDVESLLGRPCRRLSRLSVAERQLRAFGAQLARRGVAVLAVPWWCEVANADAAEGASLEERYGLPAAAHRAQLEITGYGRAIGDLLSVVDALVEHEPTSRISVFGHSLGAKLALGLAAVDTRITAAVIHEPGLGFEYSNWSAPWYLDDRVPVDRDLDELLALIAPRPVLLVGGGLRAGGDAYDGPRNQHLARKAEELSGSTHWLRLLYHDAGHTPPPYVLEACYAWLLDRVGQPR